MTNVKDMVKRFDCGEGDAYDFIRWIYGEPIQWYEAIAAGRMYLAHGGKRLSFQEFRKVALDVLRHAGYTPSDALWQWVERLEYKGR
jgi:hypothetical protein